MNAYIFCIKNNKTYKDIMSQSTPIFNIPRDNYQQDDQQTRALQNLIDDNVAIANFIPDFLSLTHVLNMQKNELQELRKNKTILEQINADFKSVQKQGLITNTVFSGI